MRFRWIVGVLLAAGGCSAGGTAKDTAGSAETGAAPSSVAAAPSSSDTSRATGADSLAPLADASSYRRVVLIVGTSLTAGLGLDPEEAYPALLQRKADSAGFATRVVAAGLSGETSAGALRRVDWLLRGRADVIVIETGANDGLRGLLIDSTRANLRAILAKVRSAQPRAVVLLAQMEAPPNLGSGYTGDFHRMFGEVAREGGATLLPFLLEGVAGLPKLNQNDGIHPNVAGSRIVADNVWRTIGPILKRLASDR